MPASAIVTSVGVGICTGHPPLPSIPMGGVIVSGSPSKQITNNAACRLTDIFVGYCGHVSVMVSASGNVSVDNLGQCRVGDSYAGILIGVLTTGAVNHTTN